MNAKNNKVKYIDNLVENDVKEKNDSEFINDDNKEQHNEDSHDEIKDNNIEKNINEDMEKFIKNFNQLNIEK